MMGFMSPSQNESNYTPWRPRKPWKKKGLKAIGLVISLSLIACGFFLMFMDRTTLKNSLAKSLSEKTETKVEIQYLDFGLSHGLGLETAGLTVRNIKDDRQLLWAESLFLEINILSLLKGDVVVENATLIKPRIKVYLKPGESLPGQFKKASFSINDKSEYTNESWAKVIVPESTPETKPQAPREPPPPLVERWVISEFRKRMRRFPISEGTVHVQQGTLVIIREAQPEPRESPPIGFSFDLKIRRMQEEMVNVVL